MSIRFQHGGAYLTDINALRDRVRANATVPNIMAIPISHPATAHTCSLFINLAYQANGTLAPATASLYTVGFANQAGNAWHFNVAGLAGLPGALIPGALDGSYGSLGHAAAPLPAISDAILRADVDALAVYAGAAVLQPMRDSLTRMIIAVSEAARFSSVATGVDGALGNGNHNNYVAPHATVTNWGGHVLGA